MILASDAYICYLEFMKIALILVISFLGLATAYTEVVHVDAVDNCLGPRGGTYKHLEVTKNVTYELSIKKSNARFGVSPSAEFKNVGVMYVDSSGKMVIVTIEPKKKAYVKTLGNLYFFLVDDARLNKGGFEIEVKKSRKRG